MSAFLAIAHNTFREAVRDRVLYLLLFFAATVIVGSEALAVLAVGAAERVAVDLGLAAISWFGVLISAFLGLSLVAREIARRTVYTVVSKPISRTVFILGKMAGLYAVVVLLAVAVAVLFLAFVWLRHGVFQPGFLSAIALMLVEDLVVAALAILFSAFTTPILATLLTMTAYVIGHLSDGLAMLASFPSVAETVWRPVLLGLYYLLPNLERLNLRDEVVVGEALPHGLGAPTVYGVVYAAAVTLIAAEVFRRKDFV